MIIVPQGLRLSVVTSDDNIGMRVANIDGTACMIDRIIVATGDTIDRITDTIAVMIDAISVPSS